MFEPPPPPPPPVSVTGVFDLAPNNNERQQLSIDRALPPVSSICFGLQIIRSTFNSLAFRMCEDKSPPPAAEAMIITDGLLSAPEYYIYHVAL